MANRLTGWLLPCVCASFLGALVFAGSVLATNPDLTIGPVAIAAALVSQLGLVVAGGVSVRFLVVRRIERRRVG